jgi:hypothetical protein
MPGDVSAINAEAAAAAAASVAVAAAVAAVLEAVTAARTSATLFVVGPRYRLIRAPSQIFKIKFG